MNRTHIVALSLVAGLAASVHAAPPLELVVSSADTIPSEPGLTWAQGSNGAFNAAGIDANGNVAFRARILVSGPVTAANDNGLWYGGPWNGGTGTLAMKAREGSPCPGIAPDAMISQFTVNNVGMSPAGHMWTGIQLVVGGPVVSANDRLILTGQTGTLAPYLREGFPAAPSLPGVNVFGAPDSTTQDKRVNASGESVAFIELAGAGIVAGQNNAAIVAGAPGAQQLVMQSGSGNAAFPAGVVVNSFGNLFLNDAGNVLTWFEYRNGIAGVTFNNDGTAATWIGGTIGVIAREGDAAHGIPGVTYAPQSGLGASTPFLFPLQPWNNQDHAIFIAILAGAVTTANDMALYAWTGGTPILVHREGDAAPDFPLSTLGAFNQNAMRLNNQDQIAWTGALVGGPVTPLDDKVLYLTSIGGATTALLREGSPVPGLAGVNFGEPVNIGINSAGWIVFETVMTGNVSTSDDRALFVRSPAGEYSLLVREGDTHFGVLVANWARNQDANGDGAASGFDDSGWLTFSVFSSGTTGVTSAVIRTLLDTPCYPDCNGVGGLTIADFGCFQTRFVAGDPYADCNGVGGLTIADFGCFQTSFVAGCP